MKYDDLYRTLYLAALKAIEATGDSYKNLSWFSRNKKKIEEDSKKNKAA